MSIEKINALQLDSATWSTPAVGYVAGRESAVIVGCDRHGSVLAYDGISGECLWRYLCEEIVTSSPVVTDISTILTAVIVGDESGVLYAINLESGELVWSVRCGKAIRATVAIEDSTDRVYIGGYGARMYCICRRTGSVVWSRYLPKHEFFNGTKSGIVSSPLIADVDLDGELEIVTGMRSRKLYCLSAKDGAFKWFREFKYDPDSSPSFAVVGGVPMVFFGGGEHTGGQGDNSVFALNGNDGSVRWQTKVGGGLDSSPTIADINSDGRLEVVITSLADASCYALDAMTGKILWRYRFGPTERCRHDENNICISLGSHNYFTADAVCRSYTSPLVVDVNNDGSREVVVGSNNGQVVILKGDDGGVVWSDDTGGMVRGSPVIADVDGDGLNELLISSDDKILIYKTVSKDTAWPMFKGDVRHTGCLDPSVVVKAGTRLPKQHFLYIKLLWFWIFKDFFRYILFQLDRRLLKPFGLRIFDYYY